MPGQWFGAGRTGAGCFASRRWLRPAEPRAHARVGSPVAASPNRAIAPDGRAAVRNWNAQPSKGERNRQARADLRVDLAGGSHIPAPGSSLFIQAAD